MENIEIVIKGYLERDWSEWLNVISIEQKPEGVTSIRGTIRDQAELFGILNRLKNLGIKILKIESSERKEKDLQEDFSENKIC
jgi:hypothetical protein